jgi:FkbM family methyltransferase
MHKKYPLLNLIFIISLILSWGICQDVVIADDILTSGKKLYSENNEELIIRDFLQDRLNGFFVDVGCGDYKDSSTTYYLEKHLGWSGIAVDALVDWAKGYMENRPKTKFYNFIVTDHSGKTESFYRSGDNLFLSSKYKSFIDWAAKEKGHIQANYSIVYVSTITLTELLEKSGISQIDFLSIDIEGSEPAALAGFDINRFKPKLVCIEAHSHGDKIMKYFNRKGYKLIKKYLKYDSQNWYFRPRD